MSCVLPRPSLCIVHAASAGNMVLVFFSVMVDKTGIAFDGDGPLMIPIIAMIIGHRFPLRLDQPRAMGHGQWVHSENYYYYYGAFRRYLLLKPSAQAQAQAQCQLLGSATQCC